MNLQASKQGFVCRYCNKPNHEFVCDCNKEHDMWDRGQRIRNRIKIKTPKKLK